MADQIKINELNNCPICKKLGYCHEDTNHDCPRCGKFKITGEAKDVLRELCSQGSEEKRSLISHIIREERIDFLDREKLEKILKNRQLPNPAEQINNAIKFLAKETKYFGNTYAEEPVLQALSGIIGSANKANYNAIKMEMKDQGIIEPPTSETMGIQKIKLTMKGWDLYEKIGISESKQIFMAMQFKKDNENESGKNFLYQLYPKISDAVREIGYQLKRIDEVAHCGDITKQIEVEIRKSACVIVDLTHSNLGAYWEAGFAHGIGKKVIYICRKDEITSKVLHFDINHYCFNPWVDSGDNEVFLNKLKSVIEAELFIKK